MTASLLQGRSNHADSEQAFYWCLIGLAVTCAIGALACLVMGLR